MSRQPTPQKHRQWYTPMIIVLSRGEPDRGVVLRDCKVLKAQPSNSATQCIMNFQTRLCDYKCSDVTSG